MRLHFLLFILLAAVTINLVSLSPAKAEKAVPFRLVGTATWDNLMNAFPPGTGMQFTDGAGQATHLGKFTATGTLLATGAPDPITGDFPVIGFVTLVAANGDLLESYFFGELNISGAGIAQFEFMGGTGRFLHASGSGTIEATLDLSNGLENVPMDVTWSGRIRY